MMHILRISFTVLAILSAPAYNHAASASAPARAGPPLKVVAIETFLADIAQNVAGSRLKVDALLPVGADPHSFEPTPADVRKIADSNVLVVNGAGLEDFLDGLLANAGGVHKVIKASEGLTGRTILERTAAETDEADLIDAMCSAADEARMQPVQSGHETAASVRVPAESGVFEVLLAKQADGTYGGYLEYSTDEGGDFQIASGAGILRLLRAEDSSALSMERTVSLKCDHLVRGSIVKLVKGGKYFIALSGFKTEKTPLLINLFGGHHHHEGDPHFWLDPRNVLKYVENIQSGLSEVDPDGASLYAADADAYIARLKELDSWIAKQTDSVPPEHRLMVTNHESFGYFAGRYGFRIIGTIVPGVSTEAAPSAKQMARLIERIKATGAKAIFLETGTNPLLARQVAQETGTKVVTELYDHSTSEPHGPAPTYIDMMRCNTKAIVDALLK